MENIQRVVKLNILSPDNPGLIDGVSLFYFCVFGEESFFFFYRFYMVSLLVKSKCEHLKEVYNNHIFVSFNSVLT